MKETVELLLIGLDYLIHEGSDNDLIEALREREEETHVPMQTQIFAIRDRLNRAEKVVRELDSESSGDSSSADSYAYDA